jgi:hypothetical protein
MTGASGSVERLTKAIVLVSLAGGFAFEIVHSPPRLALVAIVAFPGNALLVWSWLRDA